MDARLAKVRDVLQIAVDHAVAVRQAQGHGGHVVQLDVLQAVDLQAPLFELFAHRLIGLGVVLGHIADHDPVHAHLLEEAHALLVKDVAAVASQADVALHLGANLDAGFSLK